MLTRRSKITVLALATALIAGQASATDSADVFGISFKGGYGNAKIKVVDLGDDIVFSSQSSISRPCTAVLVPQSAGNGTYHLLIDKSNARLCKKVKGVILESTSSDTLTVGIKGKRKTKSYELKRLATNRDAVTLPPAIKDIRGISLGMSDDEISDALKEMPGVIQKGRASRNWGSRSNLIVYSEPSRNATEQIIVLGAGSSPGPATIYRHWEPRGDDQPDRKTLISALEDKYGKPSLRKTNRKVELIEWHFDSAGILFSEAAALACSHLSPKESKTTFSRTLTAPPLRRGRPEKVVSVSAAFECGVSMKVSIIASNEDTASEMYQTLYRHDYLLNAELEGVVANARSTIEASKANVAKEKATPKL